VLGASFDTQAENRAFAEKHGFPFPLLCDTSRALGLAYRAAERADDAFARRVTYVIGPDGRIEQALETEHPGRQAEELACSIGGS
jgi:peroxiredoxin Q/BCP